MRLLLSYRCKASRTMPERSRLGATNNGPCACMYAVILYCILIGFAGNMCPAANKQATALSTDMRTIPIIMTINVCDQVNNGKGHTATPIAIVLLPVRLYFGAVGDSRKGRCDDDEKVFRDKRQTNK